MEEAKCEACRIRPALKNSTLCQECSDEYATRLRSAIDKTSKVNLRLGNALEPRRVSNFVSRQLIRYHGKGKHSPTFVGVILLAMGFIVLAASAISNSTVLAFIGLGLTFLGALEFFIQPSKYVRSDLLDATTRSSLKAIDKMIIALGYHEKGVYVPTDGVDKAVVFIPSQAFSKEPLNFTPEDDTFLKDPEGLLVVPPGLALSNLIEKKLGFDLKNCGIDTLLRTLPKVLAEDLEMARNVEINVKGEHIGVSLFDSIYVDFCKELGETSRRCGLGCPMCSALACILAIASGRYVQFEEEIASADKRIIESSYQLLTKTALEVAV